MFLFSLLLELVDPFVVVRLEASVLEVLDYRAIGQFAQRPSSEDYRRTSRHVAQRAKSVASDRMNNDLFKRLFAFGEPFLDQRLAL